MSANHEELASIHCDCFPNGWDATAIAGMLAAKGTFALSVPGQAILMMRVLEGQAEVLTLAVREAARRKGFARELMLQGEAALAGKAKEIFLEVGEDNAAARALYAVLGYAEISRRKGYYAREGGAVDAIVMVKSLSTD